VPQGHVQPQVKGDCKHLWCDGAGNLIEIDDAGAPIPERLRARCAWLTSPAMGIKLYIFLMRCSPVFTAF
jgi:hypothetical protein